MAKHFNAEMLKCAEMLNAEMLNALRACFQVENPLRGYARNVSVVGD